MPNSEEEAQAIRLDSKHSVSQGSDNSQLDEMENKADAGPKKTYRVIRVRPEDGGADAKEEEKEAPKDETKEEVKDEEKEANAEEGDTEEAPLSPDQELRFHVAQGNEEEVTRLHQTGADVNAQDLGSVDLENEALREKLGYKMKVFPKITGDYPLHIAAERGHTKIVSQLFYLGAKMENKNRIGATALHRAVSTNNYETAKELLNLGADIHSTTKIGQTCLHIAVASGYLEMINLLLENGAKSDLRVMNKVAMTPIEYTISQSPERELLLSVDPTLSEFIAEDELDSLMDEEKE